jgi:2-hydroxychromene-2-carboxylate isomerase
MIVDLPRQWEVFELAFGLLALSIFLAPANAEKIGFATRTGYTRATYQRWFESGEAAGEEPNLSASLSEIGCDPNEVQRTAQSKRIADALEASTDEAMKLGVFGSPTFVVGDEVFWGDDRLDDAILWAKEK